MKRQGDLLRGWAKVGKQKKMPSPPKGYSVISIGRVRRSDLCFEAGSQTWGHPTLLDYQRLGSRVPSYHCVARKQS